MGRVYRERGPLATFSSLALWGGGVETVSALSCSMSGTPLKARTLLRTPPKLLRSPFRGFCVQGAQKTLSNEGTRIFFRERWLLLILPSQALSQPRCPFSGPCPKATFPPFRPPFQTPFANPPPPISPPLPLTFMELEGKDCSKQWRTSQNEQLKWSSTVAWTAWGSE